MDVACIRLLNDPDSEQDQSYFPIDQEYTKCHQPVQRTTSDSIHQTGAFNSTTPTKTEEFTISNEHPRVEVNSATTHQTDGIDNRDKSLKEANGCDFYNKIISKFPSASKADPSEMLQCFQSKITRGQFVNVTDDITILVGETNFIAVDHDNMLETTFGKLQSVEDLSRTFSSRVLWRTGSRQWRTKKRMGQTL